MWCNFNKTFATKSKKAYKTLTLCKQNGIINMWIEIFIKFVGNIFLKDNVSF